MTNEEAIRILGRLLRIADLSDVYGDIEDITPYEEAVDLAVKALEKQMSIPKIIKEIDDFVYGECYEREYQSIMKFIENRLE